MSLKPKHQRLALAIAALAALVGAALLAMWGLQDRAAYFATPADIAAGKVAAGKAMRLGGMVEAGSLREEADGVTIRFAVVDGGHRTVTFYRGIPPSLFREGSGVVAEGQLARDGTFVADNILAKHDERYMPPQLGNSAAEHAAAKTLDR
jgi:cytochrome c-type biogenesis protein CcmE